jgi:hypothetical protein
MNKFKFAALRLLPAVGLLFWFGTGELWAQEEESAEETQYREDYERVTKVVATADVMRRADQLFQFIKERPNSRMAGYAQQHYWAVLETLSKSEKHAAIITLSERLIALRPRVGETYYFYGAALKNVQKFPEAMTALAKCYVLKNTASRKAKEFLDYIYRTQNKGSMVGIDRLIKKAEAEIGK